MIHARLLCLGLMLSILGTADLCAQQLSLFTKYRENATILNPAALESDFLTNGYNISFGANYRRQWAGLDNTPETQTIRASYINPSRGSVSLTAG
ncbi:MAG: type IX secretion system membrane protein PorP/SprF, partial [Bacteroidota bacterium]